MSEQITNRAVDNIFYYAVLAGGAYLVISRLPKLPTKEQVIEGIGEVADGGVTIVRKFDSVISKDVPQIIKGEEGAYEFSIYFVNKLGKFALFEGVYILAHKALFGIIDPILSPSNIVNLVGISFTSSSIDIIGNNMFGIVPNNAEYSAFTNQEATAWSTSKLAIDITAWVGITMLSAVAKRKLLGIANNQLGLLSTAMTTFTLTEFNRRFHTGWISMLSSKIERTAYRLGGVDMGSRWVGLIQNIGGVLSSYFPTLWGFFFSGRIADIILRTGDSFTEADFRGFVGSYQGVSSRVAEILEIRQSTTALLSQFASFFDFDQDMQQVSNIIRSQGALEFTKINLITTALNQAKEEARFDMVTTAIILPTLAVLSACTMYFSFWLKEVVVGKDPETQGIIDFGKTQIDKISNSLKAMYDFIAEHTSNIPLDKADYYIRYMATMSPYDFLLNDGKDTPTITPEPEPEPTETFLPNQEPIILLLYPPTTPKGLAFDSRMSFIYTKYNQLIRPPNESYQYNYIDITDREIIENGDYDILLLLKHDMDGWIPPQDPFPRPPEPQPQTHESTPVPAPEVIIFLDTSRTQNLYRVRLMLLIDKYPTLSVRSISRFTFKRYDNDETMSSSDWDYVVDVANQVQRMREEQAAELQNEIDRQNRQETTEPPVQDVPPVAYATFDYRLGTTNSWSGTINSLENKYNAIDTRLAFSTDGGYVVKFAIDDPRITDLDRQNIIFIAHQIGQGKTPISETHTGDQGHWTFTDIWHPAHPRPRG